VSAAPPVKLGVPTSFEFDLSLDLDLRFSFVRNAEKRFVVGDVAILDSLLDIGDEFVFVGGSAVDDDVPAV
jgi:hypothetical protein